MITEDYCSYEVAKLLKEKGFEIDTNRDYWKIGEDGTMYFMSSIGAYTSNPNDEYAFYRPENSYPCPTHQMALKWLRKVHNQHVQIKYFHGAYQEFEYAVINTFNGKAYHEPVSFSSYEEAVEAALKYTLENLI